MPYVLSPLIDTEFPGLWGEGNPYECRVIYDINSSDPKLPPVNYCSHTLKPHSIPHVDLPAHIIPDGARLESFFEQDRQRCFYGPVTVLRLNGEGWKNVEGLAGIKLWRISAKEVLEGLEKLRGNARIPDRLFIVPDDVPLNEFGLHDPNYVMVPSVELANLLVSNRNFVAYGTSWKSSDFEPGSRERPVHKILLKQAVLFECLKLDHVPGGDYFLSGWPIALKSASESAVTAVLYRKDEI